MKKVFLAFVPFLIGSVAFAQSDSMDVDTKTRAIRFFVNDQALIGTISGLDPNEIERIEVDKAMGNAIRIYTKKDARKRFVALDRYLRKQFKGYGKNDQAAVFVNGVAVDAPAEAVLFTEAVKSVSRSYTPEGEAAYRVETLDDMDKQPQKGGIRIRGTAFNSGATTPESK